MPRSLSVPRSLTLALPRCTSSSAVPGCNCSAPGQHPLKVVAAVAATAAAAAVVVAVTMTAAVTATEATAVVAAVAAAAVATAVTAATVRMVAVARTILWGLPEIRTCPQTAALPVVAESSSPPEPVPP